MNPERLICGLAASLRDWQPRQFERFLRWWDAGHEGERVPIRLGHETDRITHRGVERADVGECLAFASTAATADGYPGGLIVLAELDEAYAPGILGAMAAFGQWQAMSVRGCEHGRDLWLGEVSLIARVGDQLDPDALLLGRGPAALTVWELLTGQDALRMGA